MKVWGFQRVIYHPKTTKFHFLTVSQYWLGTADLKNCLQVNPNPFLTVAIEFSYFLLTN